MKTTNHLKIFSFLEEHGCAFDNIRCDYCNVPCDSPLKSLFYYCCHYTNQEIIEFILKISSIDQIIGFSNLNGNIIDNFMEFQYYKLILIIFQKCNMVLLPLKTTKNNFFKWIQNSNEPELIDYVSKFE